MNPLKSRGLKLICAEISKPYTILNHPLPKTKSGPLHCSLSGSSAGSRNLLRQTKPPSTERSSKWLLRRTNYFDRSIRTPRLAIVKSKRLKLVGGRRTDFGRLPSEYGSETMPRLVWNPLLRLLRLVRRPSLRSENKPRTREHRRNNTRAFFDPPPMTIAHRIFRLILESRRTRFSEFRS